MNFLLKVLSFKLKTKNLKNFFVDEIETLEEGEKVEVSKEEEEEVGEFEEFFEGEIKVEMLEEGEEFIGEDEGFF